MLLMYEWRLNNVDKKQFFSKFFPSKVNRNGRGTKGDLLKHAWRALVSKFSISRTPKSFFDSKGLKHVVLS